MLKRLKRQENGQAMVEFALISPLLIFIFILIIDFGWIFGNTIIANNACRECARSLAVRYVSEGMNPAAATSYAELYVPDRAPTLNIDHVNATEDTKTVGGLTTRSITVELAVNIDVLSPLGDIFVDDPFYYDTDCTMRLE